MPSPDSSPIPNDASPSATQQSRQLLVSPPAANGAPAGRWTVTRVSSSTQTADILDEVDHDSHDPHDPRSPHGPHDSILDMINERPTQTQPNRRFLMNSMRSAGSEGRRRSRPNTNPTGVEATSAGTEELFSSFVMQMAGNGANGFEAIANNINNRSRQQQTSPLRNKIVYQLRCQYCLQRVCTRAMKAILLADTKIELYSTDIPPAQLHMMEEDRMTQGCNCRIRDTVCGCCGNVMGYHVSQPCDRCLDAKNNGHFWMFYSETIMAAERPDPSNMGKPLYWGALSPMKETDDYFTELRRYELYCR